MSWPKDWPEDAKTGPKFLAELLRRYPDSVKTGTLEDGQKWLDEPTTAGENNEPIGTN